MPGRTECLDAEIRPDLNPLTDRDTARVDQRDARRADHGSLAELCELARERISGAYLESALLNVIEPIEAALEQSANARVQRSSLR
jgi:hypothetical protein